MNKIIWQAHDEMVTVKREGVTYVFETKPAHEADGAWISRTELLELFQALKKELGLAGG